jgi:hypothetical protein
MTLPDGRRLAYQVTGAPGGRARPERTLDRFAALLAEPDARLVRENPGVRNGFLDDLRHPSPTTARTPAAA